MENEIHHDQLMPGNYKTVVEVDDRLPALFRVGGA